MNPQPNASHHAAADPLRASRGGHPTSGASLDRELAGFLRRASYALGPLGAGIILDLLDFATFGPVGLFLGALVGGCAGWILARDEGFDRGLGVAFALAAAAYRTIPTTEVIPAATALFLMARFFNGPAEIRSSAPAESESSDR